jgi:hypothetical protein
MEIWDLNMGMCRPLAMAGMPMRMAMLQGNAFATAISESGPRGRSSLAAPNMLMADIGSSFGDRQYWNLDYMGTLERWTYPYQGYPELLQIGEENNQGQPFIDAQHPHSSPVMGLTLSDTIRLAANKDYLQLFFAPRGESTDGPVAFMHRRTGQVNPDAPLGHHVGQDVGHISSTVVGGSLALGDTRIEASGFHGAEPSPDAVDLKMGAINSMALRLTQNLSAHTVIQGSWAYVGQPEIDVTDHRRYSLALYSDYEHFANTLIAGVIQNLDYTSNLTSLTEEFLLHCHSSEIWGRVEVLQRTSQELVLNAATDPHWLEALTVGYTRMLSGEGALRWAAGASFTLDFLPEAFRSAYGSTAPVTGKVFVQLSGNKMWDL